MKLDNVKRWVAAKMMGSPTWMFTPEHIAEVERWSVEHQNPNSNVWCVTPPCGDGWELWPPGSPTGGEYPYDGVTPAAVSMHGTDGDGCGTSSVLLDDILPWLRSWIAETTGGIVVEAVEGHQTYGPSNLLAEYAIFVRVGVER